MVFESRLPRLIAPERIVLTGFMGSGKSTIGRLLATELGWSFVDLDTLVEQRTSLSVPQLFAERGESAFRLEEHDALTHALAHRNTVIALGGGALETPGNRELLAATPSTLMVFLDASFEALEARCVVQAATGEATLRPLWTESSAARARLSTRLPLYAALAHLRIDTEGQTPQETVHAIRSRLLPTQSC